MQTKPIYYEDQYKKNITSKIVSLETNVSTATVVLDKTIFYPEGGGQPSDQGKIIGAEGEFNVQQVINKNGEIVHIGNLSGKFTEGETVDCSIDWERRFKNMQIHTSGHIVNDAVMSLFPDLVPVDAEHGKRPFIKYKGHLSQVSFAVILEKSNQIIDDDLIVKTEFVTLDELKKRSNWIPEHLPKNKDLRIMQIGNGLVIPDGGTQVKRTGEVGKITEIVIENEGEFTSVYYKILPTNNSNKNEAKYIPNTFASSFDSNEIINLKSQYLSQIVETNSDAELEQVRIDLFGKNGKFTNLVKKIKDVPSENKAQFGILINETKKTLESLINDQKATLGETKNEWFDPTIPGQKTELGHIHMVSRAINEIANTFEKIGFTRVRYPEVEWDWFAFGALNFPENHPARDDWETFFIDEKPSKKYGPMLLTPHTSSGQIREMLRTTPPIRMINIAKTYRRQIDAKHYPMFHQFEGLVIDKNISIVNLKGTLDYFAKSFFGETRVTRLRPYHFQFTEPSFEIDISCNVCGGTGKTGDGLPCKLCKEGWLELGGAGMVHPNVLKSGGVDPNIYSGFAFGWGVERTYMMKSGLSVPDIRYLYSSDVRVLKQL